MKGRRQAAKERRKLCWQIVEGGETTREASNNRRSEKEERKTTKETFKGKNAEINGRYIVEEREPFLLASLHVRT